MLFFSLVLSVFFFFYHIIGDSALWLFSPIPSSVVQNVMVCFQHPFKNPSKTKQKNAVPAWHNVFLKACKIVDFL